MNTSKRFQGQTVIITGGTGGLGSVVARRFLEAGASVALPVRKVVPSSEIHTGLSEAESRLLLHKADLTVEAEVQSFLEVTLKKFSSVHILANIAGGYAGGNTIDEIPLEEWEGMFALNLKTTFLMSRASVKPMLEQKWGRIINIGALPAFRSGAGKGAYATSKAAVVKLTEVMSDEVKGKGVTVNAIAPGMILTDEEKPSVSEADLKKYVSPDQITSAIMFLASEEASGVNGTVMKMYGTM